MKAFLYFSGLVLLGRPVSAVTPTSADVLSRMDRAAAKFLSMSAKVTMVTHTDVIHENTTEAGIILIKKDGKARVQALLDFLEPPSAQRTLNLSGSKVQIYFPKIRTVQIYDLGKYLDVAEQAVTLGFGTSGRELAQSYEVKVIGEETFSGIPAIRLELTPKSDDLKRVVTKLELWIPDSGDPYPLQEKIFSPSNDFHLWTYSDLKINPPLKSDALRLKLPAGVKTEEMQK